MEYKICDAGDLRKYYFQTPNLIDDLPLSVYAFRLYCHLKRVAGDGGACFQSTKTLAEKCNMSSGSVSNAKAELLGADLITIEEVKRPDGSTYHSITIVDIWARNITAQAEPVHHMNDPRSPHERARSPRETKNNPIKKNEESAGETPTPAPLKAPPTNVLLPLAQALAEVCGIPFDLNRGMLFKEAKLISPKATPETIRADYGPGGLWYKRDWRGQKGERPKPSLIRQTLGSLEPVAPIHQFTEVY